MTNPTFPWPMDHNLNNFNGWLSEEYANEVIPYLLHRLKIAEGEREEERESKEEAWETIRRYQDGELG